MPPPAPIPQLPPPGPVPRVPKPDPGFKAILSYEKNPKEEVRFIKSGEQPLWANEHSTILPAHIPEEMSLAFESKSEWKALSIKAWTKFGDNIRELPAQFLEPANGQNQAVLKLQGLRNLFPDGPGLLTEVQVEIGTGEQKVTLQMKLGTPPLISALTAIPQSPGNLVPIWVSPTVTVLPVARFEMTNTGPYSWTAKIPFRPQANLVQEISETKFNQETPCEARDRWDYKWEPLTNNFLFLRSSIPVSEFPKYLEPTQNVADAIQVKSQEKLDLTLYAIMPPGMPNPVLLGRKWTDSPRFLTPGCKPGPCKVQLGTVTYPGFCGPGGGSTVIGVIATCTESVRGFCSHDGCCNFGQWDPARVTYGACAESYQDPLPAQGYVNHMDVTETTLGFEKLFSQARVYYSDSPLLIEDQTTTPSVKPTQFPLVRAN